MEGVRSSGFPRERGGGGERGERRERGGRGDKTKGERKLIHDSLEDFTTGNSHTFICSYAAVSTSSEPCASSPISSEHALSHSVFIAASLSLNRGRETKKCS